MRRFSLLFLLLLSLKFSAQTVTETQKLESLCRIWGFLKYYHPYVAKGNLNWDKQLFQKIDDLENIDNKEALNHFYSDWIKSLGEVSLCRDCPIKENKVYFLKNFDMSWMDNRLIFSNELSQQLHYIENNRNLSDNHYLGKSGRKIYFKNEESYGSGFTSRKVSLLELFRYWNYVEYFFPYKYETDQNWNDVISEMISKFLMIRDDENYHLVLAELVTKTDDSHAYLSSKEIQRNLYGNRKVPVEYSYAEGKLVITRINSTRSGEKSPFQTGDIIYAIEGKTIPQMINILGKYVPASNSWGKVNKIKEKLLFSNSDSLSLMIEREGQNREIKTKTYFVKDIIHIKDKVIQKWKFIDNEKETGYVNMGIIEKGDLDDMYRNLKSTKSIIFDLRNYPKQTIVPLSYLLLPEMSVYYQFTFPDSSYPGKFYSRKNVTGRKNPEYYKGNVIVLVDESTQSQAETTTMMLKQHPKGKIIGSHTSGANGDVITFKIAGLDTRFTGLGAYYPDGRETQRIGIIPDIIVKPSIEGLKNGKDEVLERALEYIKTIN
ncbi:S41 family peptidase [Chryseobacterium sp.]|uniref:S41 family peptidase n=1 Tax=Chryseobacterium sp. TaxID=1871047 RepID=UPI001B0A759F|nr:S41 family peptidase [Chryseobacterium sp.]MBO9691790.1 hypothetical protein [Chryseobacterium sp.]